MTMHAGLIPPDEQVSINYLFFRIKKQIRAAIDPGRAYARRYLIEKGYVEPAERPTIEDRVYLKSDGRTTT
jgi:hypothetical protein